MPTITLLKVGASNRFPGGEWTTNDTVMNHGHRFLPIPCIENIIIAGSAQSPMIAASLGAELAEFPRLRPSRLPETFKMKPGVEWRAVTGSFKQVSWWIENEPNVAKLRKALLTFLRFDSKWRHG